MRKFAVVLLVICTVVAAAQDRGLEVRVRELAGDSIPEDKALVHGTGNTIPQAR